MNSVIATRKYLWIWSEFSLSVRKDDNKKSTLARQTVDLLQGDLTSFLGREAAERATETKDVVESLAGLKQNAKTKRHATHAMLVSVQFWLVDNFPTQILYPMSKRNEAGQLQGREKRVPLKQG